MHFLPILKLIWGKLTLLDAQKSTIKKLYVDWGYIFATKIIPCVCVAVENSQEEKDHLTISLEGTCPHVGLDTIVSKKVAFIAYGDMIGTSVYCTNVRQSFGHHHNPKQLP